MIFGDYLVHNEDETKELAIKIANILNPGNVVIFRGDLGSGKSFLCRYIIKYLCGNSTTVLSPTFNLLQIYEHDKYSIYHYDLYRLKHFEEIYELGIEEALSNNLCLIEWPEIIESLLPGDSISIEIKITDNTKRSVTVKPLQK